MELEKIMDCEIVLSVTRQRKLDESLEYKFWILYIV